MNEDPSHTAGITGVPISERKGHDKDLQQDTEEDQRGAKRAGRGFRKVSSDFLIQPVTAKASKTVQSHPRP